MKPTWEELGESFSNSESVIIGNVDCTTDGGKTICNEYGVTAYPTLKYFKGDDGHDYTGGRDLEAFKSFAASLKRLCSIEFQEPCSEAQLQIIARWKNATRAERSARVADLQEQIDVVLDELEEQNAVAQVQYDELVEHTSAQISELAPLMQLIRSIDPLPRK